MATATKKRELRKSLRQPGWITLEGGFAARQCVMQNMSSTGAKITIDDPNMLPAKLRLAFTRDARTGRPCEGVWWRGKSVGVKLVREQKQVTRDKRRVEKQPPSDRYRGAAACLDRAGRAAQRSEAGPNHSLGQAAPPC